MSTSDETPTVDFNPYSDGLAALLYAHGAMAEAADMDRKLRASGGMVPKGGFPSRCTNTDGRGVRCFLEYAHRGPCDFGSGPTVENAIIKTLTQQPVKRGGIKYGEVKFMDEPQPSTRIIDEGQSIKFLESRVDSIREQIAFIDQANNERRKKIEADNQTRAALRKDENELHEAIATLRAVRAKKLGEGGEGHGGSR